MTKKNRMRNDSTRIDRMRYDSTKDDGTRIDKMKNDYEKQDELLYAAVEKLKNGDQASFNTVYECSKKYIYKIIYDVVKDSNTVEDLMQETYLQIYNKITTLEDSRRFFAWAGRIATNYSLRYLQKNREILESDLANEDGEDFFFDTVADDHEEFIPEDVLMNKEKVRLIGEILDNLSPEQKIAVQFYYYEEMSVKEIAEACGCSDGTIKSRLNYARKSIKEAVEDLEKNKGTKLYSLSGLPLLLLLFRADLASLIVNINLHFAEGISAGKAISTVASSSNASTAGNATITSATSEAISSTAGNVAATTAGDVAATTAGNVAAATAGKAAASTAATIIWPKIAIAVAAIAVAGGGTTAAIININKEPSGADAPTQTNVASVDPTADSNASTDNDTEDGNTVADGQTVAETTSDSGASTSSRFPEFDDYFYYNPSGEPIIMGGSFDENTDFPVNVFEVVVTSMYCKHGRGNCCFEQYYCEADLDHVLTAANKVDTPEYNYEVPYGYPRVEHADLVYDDGGNITGALHRVVVGFYTEEDAQYFVYNAYMHSQNQAVSDDPSDASQIEANNTYIVEHSSKITMKTFYFSYKFDENGYQDGILYFAVIEEDHHN